MFSSCTYALIEFAAFFPANTLIRRLPPQLPYLQRGRLEALQDCFDCSAVRCKFQRLSQSIVPCTARCSIGMVPYVPNYGCSLILSVLHAAQLLCLTVWSV
jgi:hypothetical protein